MIESYEISIIISLFSLGFIGGFTHCIGMCGPFVLTQVNNRLSKIQIDQLTIFKKLQGLALIPYHLGRATTYAFIGSLSSFLTYNLKEITGFKYLSALMLMVAALIFINIAVQKITLPFKINLIQNLPFWRLKNNLKNNWIFHFIKKILNPLFLNPYNFKGYLLGILLGFIPCGLLYGAVIAASAIDNHLMAAIAMFAFAIGTFPALFVTALGGYWFLKYPEKKLRLFSKILLLFNAITLFIIAFGLILNKL